MNIFDIPAAPADGELVSPLYDGGGIRIERIVSFGQASPRGFWYDQEEDEWVLVAQGEAVVSFEEGKTRLKKGDCLLIPAHKNTG
jgi:cupin 2 domain-containing protein